MAWFQVTPQGTYLSLQVVPNAKKTEVIGPHGEALKLKIKAPPVDGKANGEIIDFLARTLGVRRNAVSIVSGETARVKRVLIVGNVDLRKLSPA